MRSERPQWLVLFVAVSLLIHGVIVWFTRSMRPQLAEKQAPTIEITLQPLPTPKKVAAKPKPPVVKPKPKVATTPPKPLPKPAIVAAHHPSRAPKPVVHVAKRPTHTKPSETSTEKPEVRTASAPRLSTPAAAPKRQAAHTASAAAPKTPEPESPDTPSGPIRPSAKPLKMAHADLPMNNPLDGLTSPEERPQAMTPTEAPRHVSTPLPAAPARTAKATPAPTHAPTADTPGDPLPFYDASRKAAHAPTRTGTRGGGSLFAMDNPLAGVFGGSETPALAGGGSTGPRFTGSAGGGSGHGVRMASAAGTGGGIGRGGRGGHGSGSGGNGFGGIGIGDDPSAGTGGDGFGGKGDGIGGGAGGDGTGAGHFRHGSGAGLYGDVADDWGPREPGDGRSGSGGHGLLAKIYVGQTLTGPALLRTDAMIDFNWGLTAAVARGVSRHFSVRWTGYIQPETTDTYTFSTFADDGTRVWIDDRQIIDDWTDHAGTTKRATVDLVGGKRYKIRIDFYENGIGHAEMHLRWKRPGTPVEVVPERCLYQRAA